MFAVENRKTSKNDSKFFRHASFHEECNLFKKCGECKNLIVVSTIPEVQITVESLETISLLQLKRLKTAF